VKLRKGEYRDWSGLNRRGRRRGKIDGVRRRLIGGTEDMPS